MAFHSPYVTFKMSREAYHLQCARNEHGDRLVINKLAGKYMERDGINEVDAFQRAAQYIQDFDNTVKNNFDFKGMRHELRHEFGKIVTTSGGW
jgi:hypothetical protein